MIYKGYDILEELRKIYRININLGGTKDKMLLELIDNIKQAAEVNIVES